MAVVAAVLSGTAATTGMPSISTAADVVSTTASGRVRAPRPALAMADAVERTEPVVAPTTTVGPTTGPGGDPAAAAAILQAGLRAGPAPSPMVINPWSASSAPSPYPQDGPALEYGARGADVVALEHRLTELGYRPGALDGVFDDATWSAVLAFQKAERLDRNGWVDPATWTRLASPQAWRPSNSVTYPRVEVDLERQVVLVAFGPRHVVTLNTSTGGGYVYTNQYGYREVAETPTGVFRVYRTYDGYDISPLGSLYRPMYFEAGYALHGSPYVPEFPDSHGCVRLSNDDMDWLWEQRPGEMLVEIHETMDPARFYPGSGGAGAR